MPEEKDPATTAPGFDPKDKTETHTDEVKEGEEIPGGPAAPVRKED